MNGPLPGPRNQTAPTGFTVEPGRTQSGTQTQDTPVGCGSSATATTAANHTTISTRMSIFLASPTSDTRTSNAPRR